MKLSGATIADIVVGGPANRNPGLEIGDTIVKVRPRFTVHRTPACGNLRVPQSLTLRPIAGERARLCPGERRLLAPRLARLCQ